MTEFKMGRKPQRQGADRFSIGYVEDYFGIAPAPTYPIDVSAGITSWGMMGNGPDPTLTIMTPNGQGQPVGDCHFAATFHDKMIAITIGHLTGDANELTSNAVVTVYLSYEVYDQKVPAGEEQDEGVIMADALLWCYQQGLISAFAPVQLTRVDPVMAQVNRGVLLGVNLTDIDQQATQNGQVWTTNGGANPPDPQNGHVVLKAWSNSPGGPGAVVSWGQKQVTEADWLAACAQEAWLILTPEDKAALPAAAWDQLVADLDALPKAHGIPVPAPVTPPVAPVPAPKPVPAPSQPTPLPMPPAPPHELPEDLAAWWERVLLWCKEHVTK